MSRQKLRQILAAFLALFGAVGLVRRAGIFIPVISKVVLAFLALPLLMISKWTETPSGLLVYAGKFRDHIFWCLSGSWLGIAAWLWNARDESTENFLKIISYYYFFMPVVISSTVFTLCYALDPDFNIRFYSASFSLSLILGFLAGRFWTIAEALPRKNF